MFVAVLCFTMALQNAIITKISQAQIRTTHAPRSWRTCEVSHADVVRSTYPCRCDDHTDDAQDL